MVKKVGLESSYQERAELQKVAKNAVAGAVEFSEMLRIGNVRDNQIGDIGKVREISGCLEECRERKPDGVR